MNSYKCNKFKRFLCKLVHKRLCEKSTNISDDNSSKDIERKPLFVKNKSGRWIHRTTGRFVKKEVVEAYYADNKCQWSL